LAADHYSAIGTSGSLVVSIFVSDVSVPESKPESIPESVPLQLPPTHGTAGAHGAKQPPQWKGSVSVSTHAPPHTTQSPGHLHAPVEHVANAGQRCPQVPQFDVSVDVSTQ